MRVTLKTNALEDDIIKGCLRGDRKYQKMLFDKYFQDMLSVCLRYSRDADEAQDLAQKGFVKVFTKIQMYNGEGSLKGWIHSIMVRTAIDHYRKLQREQKVRSQEARDWQETEDPPIEAELAAEEILKAIQQLSYIQRTVFNLFALEGYSHKEISAELNITEGTSKWHLCEARKALKKALSPIYSVRHRENAA